jgi:hypothetical protein
MTTNRKRLFFILLLVTLGTGVLGCGPGYYHHHRYDGPGWGYGPYGDRDGRYWHH